jgi:cytochrome c oxidase assembly protein subunit 11
MNQEQQNNKLTKKLLYVVIGMFGFAFALVPLYDVFCEITGINGKTSGEQASYSADQLIDKSRVITIEFVSHIANGMPWEFKPLVQTLKVHPGEMKEISFFARNRSDKMIIGQAIPSVSPSKAAEYMHKTECFCFNQQPLEAYSSADMPLRFFIDTDLPKDVDTLTLSYTLYNVTDKVDELVAEN